MASATLETFCCMATKVEPTILTHLQIQSLTYNIVCVISSVFGMMGAIYQVIPSPSSALVSRHQNISLTQKAIINWLAMADFFAASGILLRSSFWLWKGEFMRQEGWDLIACAIFAFWIRFFYTATFIWTFFYAVDVYLVCKQKSGNPKLYHVVTWTTSLLLTIIGLGTLYLPNFRCHIGPWRVLPNYLLSYIPIICVMIANPILYFLSSKNVRILLTGSLGQLTYMEHNLLSALKSKFFFIVLVFYICWFPNVINGVLLWGFWENLPWKFALGIWYVMAFVNPLQAILNSLVYKGWGGVFFCWDLRSYFCCCYEEPSSGLLVETSISDLHYTSERHTYSTNHFD